MSTNVAKTQDVPLDGTIFLGNTTGGDSSNKGCFGRKKNLFRESGNLGNFSGNMRYFRDMEQRFDITCYQTIYIE